ncbi:cytochrome-c peroxidase [Algoriphagus aquimarinus]|uniref:C-type cytochrome n=1 Tax=Algoriphagus aquimarinus TaxID=237018 RepID=A0A5C7AHV6_9BACT|nr:cytochrome c peroxidase [Algoriphagus aquimarinus]TXE08001.1 c-type cytochrome [Algoriphagus aquimarinus]
MKTFSKLFLFTGFILAWACSPEEDPIELAPEIHYYIPKISHTLQVAGFPQPERNITSEEGVALGKKLFFDPNLSSNGKVSCATCHSPELAFTDGINLADHGVSGKKLHRSAPAIFNLAWQSDGLFWDGGAHDLESLNFGPLTHSDEMDANLDEVVTYLENDNEYKQQFGLIFSEGRIESAQVTRAISQYLRTLISQDSKYDRWKGKEEGFTELELNGYQLYQKNCSSCHREGLFTDRSFHNNGLDSEYPNPPELEGLYQGRYRITSNPEDMGAYKTPTLRNIYLTAPYMHDGRFETLDEVLDHYQNGIQVNESLASQLTSGISLSQNEREALIAFLGSLTDSIFIKQHHHLTN